MKTPLVAGILASLVLLTAAPADAGTKKHKARPAATTVTAAAEGTSSETAKGAANKASANKKSAKKAVATGKQAVAKKGAHKVPSPNRHASVTSSSGETRAAVATDVVPEADKAPSRAPASGSVPASAAPADKGSSNKASSNKASSGAANHHKATVVTPAKASRFISSGVPLAEVKEGRLTSVGSAKHPCGQKSRWAKVASEWTALDEWGQAVPKGGATIADRRLYEGSGCHEVWFKTEHGVDDAARVFVAKGSGYTPAASAQWNAARDVMKRFEQLYAAQQSAWVEGRVESARERGRTLFFKLPKQEDGPEGAPTQRRPTHWAVAGGRVLVVGYVGATGAWKVGHVLAPNGKEHAYEPVAVMDMNGDGMPELIVHEEAGGVFTDRVLAFDPGTMRWEKAVESPGGATP